MRIEFRPIFLLSLLGILLSLMLGLISGHGWPQPRLPTAIDIEGAAIAAIESIPAMLIVYAYTRSQLFHNLLRGQHDERKHLLVLSAMQLSHYAYLALLLSVYEISGTPALFILCVGGLAAGWRVGMWLGVERILLWIFLLMLDRGGAIFDSAFLNDILLNPWVMGGPLVGAIAGYCRKLLDWPVLLIAIGALPTLYIGLLYTIAAEADVYVFPLLLPASLVGGMELAGFALMLRMAQAEIMAARTEAAERSRLEAELRALRSQINPHFLFNSLNTIRYFTRIEPVRARQLLLDLSDVFQQALRAGEFVTLEQELVYVQAYLNLEQARMGERLEVALPSLTPEMLAVMVPTLILQPIVENAVIHGVGKRAEGGLVRISAETTKTTLTLTVHDKGVGMPKQQLETILDPDTASDSIGLRNVHLRLKTLYNNGLHISSAPDAGTAVSMTIPL